MFKDLKQTSSSVGEDAASDSTPLEKVIEVHAELEREVDRFRRQIRSSTEESQRLAEDLTLSSSLLMKLCHDMEALSIKNIGNKSLPYWDSSHCYYRPITRTRDSTIQISEV